MCECGDGVKKSVEVGSGGLEWTCAFGVSSIAVTFIWTDSSFIDRHILLH